MTLVHSLCWLGTSPALIQGVEEPLRHVPVLLLLRCGLGVFISSLVQLL